jgi:hypothetical protein
VRRACPLAIYNLMKVFRSFGFCGLHYLAKTFVVPVDIGKNLKYAFLNEIT